MNEEVLRRIEECKRTKATNLDLVELMLTEIPSQLAELVWLKELLLNDNQIRKIEGLDKLNSSMRLYQK